MAFFVILLRSDIAFGSYICLRQVIFTFGEFRHSLRSAIDFVAIAIPSLRSLRRAHILVLGTPFLVAAAPRVPFLNILLLFIAGDVFF